MKTKFSGILTLLLAFIVQITFAQEKTISGTVTDDKGLPLPGVNVVVKNTSNGTQTDFDGNYSITANRGAVLSFSYVGFAPKEIALGDQSTVDVQLAPAADELDEVVVVAYGSQTKKKLVTSVSTIRAEDLEDIQADSPQDFLQGQASGVQVISSSGVLGSAPVIKIRGVASITSGGRPLFVIDGVPLGDDFLTAAQGGVQGLNPLASINPNDIENISVLKSASATAVYGSRGANGVVLITTKRGRNDGNINVSIDVNTSFATETDSFDLLNGQQFREYVVLAGQNGGAFGPDITEDALPQGDFDWVDAIFRTAVSRNYNASVSGGSENTNFFLGATFQDQEGILVGNNLERTSVRINVTTKAKKWLTLGANSSVSLNEFDRVPTENAFAAPYTAAGLQRPYVLPTDEFGEFVNTGQVTNVVAQEALELNLATTTRITGNIFAEAEIFKGLKFKSDLGVDRTSIEVQSRDVELLDVGGIAGNDVNQQNRTIFTNTLNYKEQFGNHGLDLIGGMSYERNDLRNIAVTGTGFLDDTLLNVESAAVFTQTFS